MPAFETLGKVHIHTTASFHPFQPSHIPAHITSCCALPATVLPALDTAALTRRAALLASCEYWNLEVYYSYLLNNAVSRNENFYEDI